MILRQLYEEKQVSIYDLSNSSVPVYITSTPQTSNVLINPEIRGVTFQNLFTEGLDQVIKNLPQVMPHISFSENVFDVIYILRGGLNFNLHQLLGENVETSFISSQRLEDGKGNFVIGEDGYEKWSIQDDSTIVIGDISATATTFRRVFQRIITEYDKQSKIPNSIILFTVGTNNLIDLALEYNALFKNKWKNSFTGITIIYLEQIFDLYKGGENISAFHLSNTDFFRRKFPSTIEFEIRSLNKVVAFLERCAIYDGGSRSFEPRTYKNNLLKYWRNLIDQEDITLEFLLNQRTNLLDYLLSYDDWIEKRLWWSSLDKNSLKDLYELGQTKTQKILNKDIKTISLARIEEITNS